MKWKQTLCLLSCLAISCTVPSPKQNKASASKKSNSHSFDLPATDTIPQRREYPVNNSVNACVDFHQYACSKVEEGFSLRADRRRHSFAFDDASEKLLEYKKAYFKRLATIEPRTQKEEALKTFFLACMNEKSRAAEERALVQSTINELGGINSKQEFQQFLGRKLFTPDFGFIDFGVIPNQKRPEYNDLYWDTELMTLPEKTYYDKPEVVAGLQSVMELFFQHIEYDQPKQRAEKLIKFEKELAKVYPTPVQFRELVAKDTYTKRSTLINGHPSLMMQAFFSRIPAHTQVRHFIPDTMVFLDRALNELPLETLKDIYLYGALSKYMDDAYPEYFKAKFDFSFKHLGGPEVRSERQERCTKQVMGSFSKELDFILMPELFPDFPKQHFTALAEKIRETIVKDLEQNQWLRPAARQEALKKIKTASLQLVAPENDEEWDFNPSANYSNFSPIANEKSLEQLLNEKAVAELKGPVSKRRWGMSPLIINAYYHPSYNKFVLPVGILQYPFYDPNLPDAMNLAAIGTVIGHELGHAIDDKGSKYDATGLLRDWMNAQDLQHFKQRSSPLISQFDKAGHNGSLTLGENIGDLVGLSAAYKSAFPAGSQPSNEQLQAFFLQYGRVWCEVQRPGFIEYRLKVDPHALGKSRINEQVKHQPGFKQAFSCKDNDPMVLPESQQVRIW